MNEGIELYIKIFEKVSSYYSGDQDEKEINISERISDLFSELKKNYDKELVEKSILFMLCIFENYYLDDFNSFKIDVEKISLQERDKLNGMLDNEFFDEIKCSTDFDPSKIKEDERKSIISILKKEITI